METQGLKTTQEEVEQTNQIFKHISHMSDHEIEIQNKKIDQLQKIIEQNSCMIALLGMIVKVLIADCDIKSYHKESGLDSVNTILENARKVCYHR